MSAEAQSRGVAGKWVRLKYPARFKLGLRQLAELAGWEVRRDGGDLRVCVSERYRGERSRLFRLTRLADASNASDPSAYDPFRRWSPQDSLNASSVSLPPLPELVDPKTVEDFWTAFQLRFLTLPDAAIPDYTREVFSALVGSMPSASIWSVSFESRLTWRLAAARTLFAAQATPEVLESAAPESRMFPASMAFLRSQGLGFDAYLEPPLVAVAPWIAGVSSHRRGGAVIILFGEAAAGFRDVQTPELLHLFKPSGFAHSAESMPRPTFEAASAEAALRWWVDRLDELFGLALDVGRYATADGTYDPTAQVGVLLSIERLFQSVLGVLAHAKRDAFVRSLLLFDVVDLLEGLTYSGWKQMFSLKHVQRALAGVEAALPEGAGDALLPRCRRAVDALATVRDGFASVYVDNDTLRTLATEGRWETQSLDAATAAYMRIARNASHSYRGWVNSPREVALMATHNDELPDELADLALLHLLAFLRLPRLPA